MVFFTRSDKGTPVSQLNYRIAKPLAGALYRAASQQGSRRAMRAAPFNKKWRHGSNTLLARGAMMAMIGNTTPPGSRASLAFVRFSRFRTSPNPQVHPGCGLAVNTRFFSFTLFTS